MSDYKIRSASDIIALGNIQASSPTSNLNVGGTASFGKGIQIPVGGALNFNVGGNTYEQLNSCNAGDTPIAYKVDTATCRGCSSCTVPGTDWQATRPANTCTYSARSWLSCSSRTCTANLWVRCQRSVKPAMVITDSGRVGIGTAAPGAALDIRSGANNGDAVAQFCTADGSACAKLNVVKYPADRYDPFASTGDTGGRGTCIHETCGECFRCLRSNWHGNNPYTCQPGEYKECWDAVRIGLDDKYCDRDWSEKRYVICYPEGTYMEFTMPLSPALDKRT